MATVVSRGKVGLFGIGLAAYWPQFTGMKRRLEGYQRIVAGHWTSAATWSMPGWWTRRRAAPRRAISLLANGVDLIVCYVGTYATSSQVLPAVQGRMRRC